jgi:hypothetical protein
MLGPRRDDGRTDRRSDSLRRRGGAKKRLTVRIRLA